MDRSFLMANCSHYSRGKFPLECCFFQTHFNVDDFSSFDSTFFLLSFVAYFVDGSVNGLDYW